MENPKVHSAHLRNICPDLVKYYKRFPQENHDSDFQGKTLYSPVLTKDENEITCVQCIILLDII
jgi:hypothetical protein